MNLVKARRPAYDIITKHSTILKHNIKTANDIDPWSRKTTSTMQTTWTVKQKYHSKRHGLVKGQQQYELQ